MSDGYQVVPASDDVVRQLSATCPRNPFATPAYFAYRRRTGWTPWVFVARDPAGRVQDGCGAFVKWRGWNRKLEIPSLPPVSSESSFWPCLREFCRRRLMTKVQIDTFGTPAGAELHPLGTDQYRDRCEYVLDLTGDLDGRIDRRHKSHLKKAAREGLVVETSRTQAGIAAHREMIGLSMERRRERGEDVTSAGALEEFDAILSTGAGELYLVSRDDVILASGLVLRAPRGAYFHTRGTSPDGMALGASHFLVRQLMETFQADGLEVFNIGGADEGSGLERFKKRFGAQPVHLPSATSYVGPRWLQETNAAFDRERAKGGGLLSALKRRVRRLLIYSVDLDRWQPKEDQCLMVHALSAEELRAIPPTKTGFHERQLDRLRRFGRSYAHGVYVDDELAHVSWLLPAAATEQDVPHLLKLQPGEAEITGAETLPSYRNKGLYSRTIVCILEKARHDGHHRVYMKVEQNNQASITAVERAGLRLVGSITLLELPVLHQPLAWRPYCPRSPDWPRRHRGRG